MLDLFKSAIQYANFDFFKLKEEVLSLIKIGREQGLDYPDYCRITIKNPSRKVDYPVSIDLYYKTDEQGAMHLPKSFLVGSFKSIPSHLEQVLIQNGFLEIRIDNLLELSLSANEEVSGTIKFDSVVNFIPKTAYKNRKILIKDDLFTYKVVYSYETLDGTVKSKTISYADIINIPMDVSAKLKENGECIIKLN